MSLRHISRVCLRVVQGAKDNLNSRGTIKPPQAKPRSESDNSGNVRRVSGMVDPAKKVGSNIDNRRRLREAEKAENVMHLICWGPS